MKPNLCLVLFLLLLGTLTVSASAAVTNLPARDECQILLNRLDLDRPDLKTVNDAMKAGNQTAAFAALAAHFRTRFSKSDIKPKVINNVARDADESLQWRFRSRSSPDYFELHKDFEWNRNPIGPKDQHWLSLLASMDVLEFQADMFIKTGDEKYARGCQLLFEDWSQHCPPGSGAPSWSLATAMMREAVLIEVFKRMVQWPNWPAEAEAHLLNSIYEHAEFMNSKRGPGNQDITNSEHLMRVAAAFPEFKNAAPWCDSGFARIKDKIFDDVLEDGAQKELCSGYHLNAITSYTNAMMRVRATGHDVSPDFLKRLEKMYEWCMVMVRPDGGVPTNGDSEGRGAREYLQQGAELFHRPDMAYVASEGKAGTKPDHLDMSLPIAGYYTLRSGWTGQNDLYLFMDISRQPVVSHQYFDALHIALFAYGRDFFPAMGTFTYGGQYHKDARATKNQTTVTIDDRDQGDVPATCNAFASSPALSFLDGSQAGYPGITHRRQVLFVRPAAGCIPYFMVIDRITGSGQHVVDQYFHFPPGKLQAADGRAQTLFPDGANIVVTNLATDGLETTQIETDMHPSQGQTVKRPSVRFRHSGNLPVTYVTLLVPYQGTNPPALNAHLLGNAGAITVQVDQPGGKDVLSVTAAPSRAMLDRTTPQGEQKTELPGKP